jgi:endonuclease YncB( thermonuclease family)
MGRLRARGNLQLSQFWPDGQSDADTANLEIKLDLSPSFVFRPDAGVETATSVFNDANWKDRSTLKPILGSKKNKLRVRLQGIDAPELHYLPRVKGAKNFRQRLAESAVFALREKLLEMADGSKMLRADAITFIESPNDAFDVYGRFVGNVTVYADGFALDINHWLLEHGWAVPGLYNSMTERELNVARSLSNRAAMDNLGLYKSSYYKNKLVKFEKDLVVRHKVDPKTFKLYEDKGDVMNPKFFRRQATFESKEANNPTGTEFRDSLLADKNYRGLTWTTFSALKASERKDPDALKKQSVLLGSLISKTGKLPKADDLIYIEEAADIVDSKGMIINDWDFPLPSLPSNKKSTKRKSKK